jgi:hypothetical protein
MIPNHTALMILRSASLFFIVLFLQDADRGSCARYITHFSGLLCLIVLSIALGCFWVLGASPALRSLWRRTKDLWRRLCNTL